jgi:hypothetical protein
LRLTAKRHCQLVLFTDQLEQEGASAHRSSAPSFIVGLPRPNKEGGYHLKMLNPRYEVTNTDRTRVWYCRMGNIINGFISIVRSLDCAPQPSS